MTELERLIPGHEDREMDGLVEALRYPLIRVYSNLYV